MKAQYLLDECISNSLDRNTGQKDSRFVCSVNVLGGEATDEEIYEYAKARNLTIITKDLRFEYFLMDKKHPFIFRNHGRDIVMKPIKIPDAITASLLENDDVVRP